MKYLLLIGLFSISLQQFAQDSIVNLTKITNIETSYPSWSPDGKILVFQSNRNDNDSEIYLSDIKGQGQKRLTHNPGKDEYPVFSPDGKSIAFSSHKDGSQDIFIMDLEGNNQKNITKNQANDIHPQFSPNGETLLFNSNRNGNYDLFIVDLKTWQTSQITSSPYPDTYAHWAPDGSKLVFVRWMPINENKRTGDIFILDLISKKETRLTTNPSFDGWPTWSANGDFLLFASNRHNGKDFQIFKMKPDGSQITKITHGDQDGSSFTKPVVDMNTGTILCTRTKDGNVEIFTLDLN